jgi:hypothetical protein
MGSVVRGFLGALIGASSTPKVARVATPHGAVVRNTESIMQQRGWQAHGKGFSGPYATPLGTWAGHIVKEADRFRVYIKNPPMHLIEKHPTRACFHDGKGGWWSIHLHTEPVDGDINSVIAYIERVLREAATMSRRAT